MNSAAYCKPSGGRSSGASVVPGKSPSCSVKPASSVMFGCITDGDPLSKMKGCLLLHGASERRDVVVDEHRVEDRDRKRAEQGTGHQRAPLIDVARHEFGQDRN